ncbi:tetratricopeptide repeat-containing sensor histidine kinase [Hymenobacter cellulosivorans]|uniref:histidine kinase n=1 Tax=Hymenobacter cellulosivorans TaxID=2932249 RepID=A0ABY4FB94_9BACT|nr:tetratricopeptide repeat protein [Hymenobacter cellulosivorans]UOQ53950.1 tetratricopeptide repeat protein [Hymenobacter cellulosivorans]
MRKLLPILFLGYCTLLSGWARAQSPQTAGLRTALARASHDTTRVLVLADLSASYRYSRFDSVLWYARQGLQLARRIGYAKGEGRCLSRLGILMSERGNLPQALRIDLQALQLHEQSHDPEATARTLNQMGLLYHALEDYRPALSYYFRAKRIYEQGFGDDSQLISVLTNLGASYEGRRQLDSAQYFLNRAYDLTRRSQTVHQSCWGTPLPYVLRELGLLRASLGQPAEALTYYRRSAQASFPENDRRSACRAYQYMAELYHSRQQLDSSVYYARKSLVLAQSLPFIIGVVHTSQLLTEAFQARQRTDSTLKYMHIMLQAEDSLYNPQRIKQLDAIGFAEQQRLRELELERTQFEARNRLYILAGVLGSLILLALLLWRNNRLQQRANARLSELNEEITSQRDSLGRMLHELKITQSQLVLREKMASLGELMAGVAHEIQTPVNSMRDLAGVSADVVESLRRELVRPDAVAEPDTVADNLQTLSQYQQSIVRSSQRAASIVTGMLEYSSTSPGPLQATDVNAFVEDYLRLTYHDTRAKNRSFYAALLPTLDPTVGNLSIIRHDLGRALISLFTNAFHSVQQRQLLYQEGYIPQVAVSTRKVGCYIEIRVRDNGLGIPPKLLPKVFERFFTTQAPEVGSSLGLALSYDLITKGHGGTLTVESQEGEYTEFVVTLPLTAQPSLAVPAAAG